MEQAVPQHSQPGTGAGVVVQAVTQQSQPGTEPGVVEQAVPHHSQPGSGTVLEQMSKHVLGEILPGVGVLLLSQPESGTGVKSTGNRESSTPIKKKIMTDLRQNPGRSVLNMRKYFEPADNPEKISTKIKDEPNTLENDHLLNLKINFVTVMTERKVEETPYL